MLSQDVFEKLCFPQGALVRSCGPAWTIALHLLEMMYLDQAPAVNHGFHDLDQLEAKAVLTFLMDQFPAATLK